MGCPDEQWKLQGWGFRFGRASRFNVNVGFRVVRI